MKLFGYSSLFPYPWLAFTPLEYFSVSATHIRQRLEKRFDKGKKTLLNCILVALVILVPLRVTVTTATVFSGYEIWRGGSCIGKYIVWIIILARCHLPGRIGCYALFCVVGGECGQNSLTLRYSKLCNHMGGNILPTNLWMSNVHCKKWYQNKLAQLQIVFLVGRRLLHSLRRKCSLSVCKRIE